jgi:hypothetical protein
MALLFFRGERIMDGQTREPAQAPQPGPAHVSAAPARPTEPGKPHATAVTLDRPHDDHVDEPGYGHGV